MRIAIRRIRRVGLGLLALFAAAAIAPRVPAQAPRAAGSGEALVLDVEGAIGPATADYLRQGFSTAAKHNAAVIILRMDTPGGLDTAMRDIIRGILASPVPVIAYVSPSGARAASAGTYILYASQLAAMAPGTNLGAATPVAIGGLFGGGDSGKSGKDSEKNEPTDTHARKAVNDAVAYIRGLATLRGRNADWAEQAVRNAASLPAKEALAKGVIELIASSEQDLLTKANGRTVHVGEQDRVLNTTGLQRVDIKPDWREQILSVITDPNIAYLLLLAGIYGLLFEFINPGAVAPGVIGAIALLTGLYALNLLPINYAGVGLMLLGVALMVAEAFLPTFGIVGFGGIAAFVIGSLLMFDAGVPGFGLSWSIIATGAATTAAFLLLAVGVVWRAHRRKVVTGEEGLLGQIGRVITWDGEYGRVHVRGEVWHAQSHAGLSIGQAVRVVGRNDLTLIIEAAPQAPRHQ